MYYCAEMSERMAVLAGPSHAQLGAEVADLLRAELVPYECRRFPDGEAQVELSDAIPGRHVYLIHSTSPPVDQRLLELVLLADACRRAGALRITGVIPYFGYARQDRRTGTQSLGARVAADIVSIGRFDRLMLIDAHTPSIEGFLDVPLDHLSAVPLLAIVVRPFLRDDTVVVSPDLGAVKRARDFARLLNLPMAYVHKTRVTGREVEAQQVVGDVHGRRALIVDDMVSTGATIEAAMSALREAGALEPAIVGVTHALLTGDARNRLRRLPIDRLVATNTIPVEDPGDLRMEIAGVAPLIVAAIRLQQQDGRRAD